MTNPEAAIAWRLFELNWFPLAAMFVALAVGVTITGFSIAPFGALTLAGISAIYVGFAYRHARASDRGNPKLVFMLGGFAQALLIPGLMAPLTYVAASAAFPLQDENFYKLDLALGLDWRAYLSFVNDRPLLSALLAKSYGMIGPQMLVIPLVLSALGRFRRLQQYILALALTLIVTTAISFFVPALGTYHRLGLVAADHPNVTPDGFVASLIAIRDGSLRHLNLADLAGVVTFPSFHAAAAVLFVWALWPVRWVGLVAMVVNLAMLAATPVGGSHYFVDVFAGIALAFFAIAAAGLVDGRLAERLGVALQGDAPISSGRPVESAT